MLKQVKTVFDGKSFWLLWHWETLRTTTPLAHATTYVSGPFAELNEAEQQAETAKVEGWTTIPFQTKSTHS